MPKMISPNNAVYWVPVAGIADPTAPKATEVAAGTDLSPAIATGYKLGATASDTDNSKTIVDEGNVKTPTLGNYEGDITFFRSDLTNVTAAFNTAYNLFKVPRGEGYLVHRIGYKDSVAPAAAQEVSLYRFIADSPKDVEGSKGAPIQFSVKFRPQGSMNLNVALA